MARKFTAGPLHPGALYDGGDNIVFVDPYPSTLPNYVYRVNIPYSVFMRMVWNMQEWNVAHVVSITANDGTDPSETFTGSNSGKFAAFNVFYNFFGQDGMGGFSGYEYVYANLYGTNSEPVDKMRGGFNRKYVEHNGDPLELPWDETTTESNGIWLIPASSFIAWQQTTDIPLPIELTVDDELAAESGNVTADLSWGSLDGATAASSVYIEKAWVKNDGTVDVFVEARFAVGGNPDELLTDPTTDPVCGRIELVNSPVTTTASVCADLGSVTISLLGVDVTAYLRENLNNPNCESPQPGPYGEGISSSGTITLTDFSFSYGVTTAALWTY